MPAILEFAKRGGPVLGICNGFQVLLEAGLLPGAMLRNRDLKFHCEQVFVRVEQTDTPFTAARHERAAAEAADRARRRQLLRVSRGHPRARGRRPGRLPLLRCERRGDRRGEPERRGQQYRRHLQRGPQRRRPDAASGARLRSAARQRRRARPVRVGRHRARARSFMIRKDRSTVTQEEYDRIVSLLKREPTDTELGIFSVMWSEHCSYKSSRIHLKKLPTTRQAGAAGAGRERRRRRHRRRPRRGLQDRVAQPSVVHRAVPGGRDRRRRHHPRHLHDGRAPDRAAELAALRSAGRSRRRPHAPHRRRRGRRHRRLRQQHRHPDHRRRDRLRGALRGQPARQRALPRDRRRGRARQGQGVGRRQSRLLRRREDRPRRHPRRDDGVGGVRREVGARSVRPCRSAIRSWRSCCSRRASS